jgi:DNA helicase-2/ATP-dependent DNA helicase PcrA
MMELAASACHSAVKVLAPATTLKLNAGGEIQGKVGFPMRKRNSQERGVHDSLNEAQLQAVLHDDTPLLIVAGAGTGKTKTLVHRVAHLIERGVPPARILLLTFTRRAAEQMLRRVDHLLRQIDAPNNSRGAIAPQLWGGTFHATAARLLRAHGRAIGLEPGFTIHDRADSEDLLDLVRTELKLDKSDKRFPKKRTCLAIYSHVVNSQKPLNQALTDAYPWCLDFAEPLKRLFQEFVDRKEQMAVLDYDDLLLFWRGALADVASGRAIRERFDCVLVDEYQDTNRLQAEILQLLRPDGRGLSAVGDDAQSIYSFRAATVRNILDFAKDFPGASLIKLEQNYRSTNHILIATNALIAEANERHAKSLWSTRDGGSKPLLVTCDDEGEQADILVRQILEHREGGIELRRQAVLFRASHHSILLEGELLRRNIPFVKFGGLKFLEAAHIKDLMSFLRLAENPRDVVAGLRVLTLLPGIGPQTSRKLVQLLVTAKGDFSVWKHAKVPAAAKEDWPKLVKLMEQLVSMSNRDVASQVRVARLFYGPWCDARYDNPGPRLRDLEQLEQLAGQFSDRSAMLAEITLDPPSSTQDLPDSPLLDDDYLILSTIHSAKGLEWDVVYVMHASDGCIPSDLATKSPEEIDEERRLFYVALTRAKDWLYVMHPLRYFFASRGPATDRYGYAQLTRFMTPSVEAFFQRCAAEQLAVNADNVEQAGPEVRPDIRRQTRAIWD